MALPPLVRIPPLAGIRQVRATIETNLGVLWAELDVQRAPQTVANFVLLAEGRHPFLGAEAQDRVGMPYFDGLTMHRVVPRFVVQGGCVRGDGSGNPGYRFADEIHRGLAHDRKGVLSMANAGRDTNDTQFFLTLGPCRELDGRHTVFGHVEHGVEVVDAMGRVAVGPGEFPVEPIILERVSVECIG
ncbi:MAG: peptidylprolyl isomerase [Deltaproteobacteria bacterium]|nr:peptidylprolyl isomerase [Deltaproteobacteria bacterium]